MIRQRDWPDRAGASAFHKQVFLRQSEMSQSAHV